MHKLFVGDLFSSNAEAVVVPTRPNLALEGSLGSQIRELLPERSLKDISLLKKIHFLEATMISTHNKEDLGFKNVIMVANYWEGKTTGKTDEYLESCFTRCFELARDFDIKSIAFPAISTGLYDITFPRCYKAFKKVSRKYEDIMEVEFYIPKKDTYYNNIDLFSEEERKNIQFVASYKIDAVVVSNERKGLTAQFYKENDLEITFGSEKHFQKALALAKAKVDDGIKKIYEKDDPITDEIIYEGVCSRSMYFSYKNGKVSPSKNCVIGFGINLGIAPDDINELLESIGEKFNFDYEYDKLLYSYLVKQYNLKKPYYRVEINEMLESFNFKPLFNLKK